MSQKNDLFAPVKALFGLVDLSLALLGLSFVGLLIFDAYTSRSNLPEATWYAIRRNPPAYPQEIATDIERMRDEIHAEIREELENSETGCISFANVQNAICVGPRQTVRMF
ncbi:hypothetical protein IQ273_18220 [Nodosilinea sp. LEGE 07298]|uniref:hypothetical protein n=1 Tax=Nodosilinea sp. LEGE 07298 TaxID=2777970 RepID=UPI00187E2B0B|nr:hypothetical protein [Nodosilinea sp. LEGE 07298]MBE9111345.1 hypothetical protein [Nodosilinea sp. LEGE 07298]